ncbi:NADH:flavin oxidoreductase/NADH oxidase [Paenibacillus ginsengarvi]|uniref:NADH:flavin oxidoreductase/NADH oxidase n=1 Tax=Paenibacillus ginsengarvi TaxID=400777 RepID=A0A3B0CDW9_9BACL|nr:NADH:flavin oxidoreductase/NADH oxidase [Paenibacillus ginsengarvi]RKN83993.1 NADH:flavin oxidoreductase/NADH oxidase [Paenibacillus ginsengarvi]
MNRLFTPFSLLNLELRNRIVMPPMCQYSVQAKDGKPNDWHYVHYASRAVGGAGLVIMEMTDVEPDGRITDYDLGLWSDEQIPAFARVISAVHSHGAKVGIQIAHAGRKAQDAEVPVAPSVIPVDAGSKTPRALTTAETEAMVDKFRAAAVRAIAAGVDTIELHGAHGYLIHQFHSPALNRRDDVYGKDLSLFGVQVIRAVKSVMPAGMPLALRISAIEYIDGGYGIGHGLDIARSYRDAGVDLFHVSTGGEGPAGQRKPGNYPGYQVPFARAFKQELGVPVIAVGILDEPALADSAVANGDADLVAVGRGMLRDPYWAIHAIRAIAGKEAAPSPKPYARAF